LFHPYATHTHTLDEDQETKMVSSNSASLSTGFDITIDEDGIDMNETFSISLTSGHSTDMKRRVHTTYSDYMGSNSDHLVEEESSQFHETTLSGNLDDGITLTQTNRNSSSTFNTTNGVAATPVIYSNNPEPVVTVIVPSAADQAAAAAATQTNEGTAGESEGDNQTTTTEGTTNPDASSESGTGSDADAFSPIVKPQGVPEGGTFDPITGNVYDADGNLFGKLDADGNVYWPLEWPPGNQTEATSPIPLSGQERVRFAELVMEELLSGIKFRDSLAHIHFYKYADNPDKASYPFPIRTAGETVYLVLMYLKDDWDVTIVNADVAAFNVPVIPGLTIPKKIVDGAIDSLIGTMLHEQLHRLGNGFAGTGLALFGHLHTDVGYMIPPSGIGTVEHNFEDLANWAKSQIHRVHGTTLWDSILARAANRLAAEQKL
jgi:hypothetical protein